MSSSTMSLGTKSPGDQPAPTSPALPVMDTYQPVATDVPMQVVNTAPTAQSQSEIPTQCPPSYITLNIVAMLFLCFFFGLIGLIYSMKVESEWRAGNHAAAVRASRSAHMWGGAAVIVGGGSFIVTLITVMSLRLGALTQ